MKKIIAVILAAALLFSMTACGNAGEGQREEERNRSDTEQSSAAELSENETAGSGQNGSEDQDGSGILVAYFSWSENAILEDDVDAVASPSVIAPGNVQQLAGWIQEETGGNLFSIQVTDPYSSDWDACLERANQERRDQERPELKGRVENLDQYDTVFLGYPNWWYGVPMALLTFLEENDLSGKQVYLFCSHGTGGLARSVEIITEAAPEAIISDNIFECYEEDAASSQDEIHEWVRGI